jgi:transposase
MARPDYWAKPPLKREATQLYYPTLDAVIAEDDPVRLLDDVLSVVDWSPWEAEYHPVPRGQPPIHPRHLAAVILYGLFRRIRSSRRLEECCCYRFDFIWLVEGRRPDYSTIAKFRTRFRGPLKDLFRQIGRMAMTLGLVRLGEVAFDGTRVKANNSRYASRTAKTLEEKLQALDQLFEQMMAEWEALDEAQASHGSPTRLPEPLAKLEQRREQVRDALEKVKAGDEARRKNKGIQAEKNPAQIPTTDTEARVMPNKEGGYAPNYTPTATTDGHRGFIVDCDVIAEVNESQVLVESVERIEENFGQKPQRVLTDAGNSNGLIMQEMEERGVEFYAPVESQQPQEGNPALRADPTQPVPEAEWPKLPRNPKGQLDKSCFVYDAQKDQYYCPQGQTMGRQKNKFVWRGGVRVTVRVYRSRACAGCPLAAACLSPTSKQGNRTIARDQYEEVRERTAARMATPSARQLYQQRPRIAETPFGILKSVMGLRQFLLRGLEKVKTEWRWAATAFNLHKLVRELARLRAEFGQMALSLES